MLENLYTFHTLKETVIDAEKHFISSDWHLRLNFTFDSSIGKQKKKKVQKDLKDEGNEREKVRDCVFLWKIERDSVCVRER